VFRLRTRRSFDLEFDIADAVETATVRT